MFMIHNVHLIHTRSDDPLPDTFDLVKLLANVANVIYDIPSEER